MRRLHIVYLLILSFAFYSKALYAQQKIFNKIDLKTSSGGGITAITQDQQGYIWLNLQSKGLARYDGSELITFIHSEKDTSSITGAPLETIAVDSSGFIWIGTLGGGMDRFDPSTNTFSHFRHRSNDPTSLGHDTVTALLTDHSGNLWVGTYRGLDRYDQKTGTFVHYTYRANDPNSLSGTHVRVIYEDKSGNIWVGCGSPWPNEESWKDEGGLNRFDRRTGKFTRFLHDPNDPRSLENNKVRALFEDSKGNFWVGTAGDGLQTLDRQSGMFNHYHYDATHPENLSRGPVYKWPYDQVEFITEDAKGKIWIGTYLAGIIEYDPQSKKAIHHGYSFISDKTVVADTLSGFDDNTAWASLVTKDGMVWITTLSGSLYQINPSNRVLLPYTKVYGGGNAFYKEVNGTFWIGTNYGLIRKDAKTGEEKVLRNDPVNANTLGNDIVNAIVPDEKGMLWLGTYGGGLDLYDPVNNRFYHFQNDSANRSSITEPHIVTLLLDSQGSLWVGTAHEGLDKMNRKTGTFSHFQYDAKNSNSLSNNGVNYIQEAVNGIWVATEKGLNNINKTSGKIKRYLQNNIIKSVFNDSRDVIWAGATEGLYVYNQTEDTFLLFDNSNLIIDQIINIIEDKNQNLWISSTNSIFKIDSSRTTVRRYNSENGVHLNLFTTANNYKDSKDELYLGDHEGYYHFYPSSLKEDIHPPFLNFASLQIGGKEIHYGANAILKAPLYSIKELKLPYNKNSFSFGFTAIDYHSLGEKRVIYRLENYDNGWLQTGSDKRAYFYNIPVGRYTLRVRAVNSAGGWIEKILAITITPPWWQTWWAITIFAITLIGVILGYSYYRSYSLRKENRLLEEKVKNRTLQLQQSVENLKATQNQLIQSEKMASLGELTAGIAHEIQNPLNFVNNFSEVNKELVDELQNELKTGTIDEAIAILGSIKENGEKINFHGKRADAIVKGMLQHASKSMGQKELTDINKLAEEYLKLSYHGLRAKDKDFNATFNTAIDESVGKIHVVPQDLGRVLLNLFNNAFYSVNKKKKQLNGSFEPVVIVCTRKQNNKITISIKDNGGGIPQKTINKIFQPFYTTKPTGEGTGLGLSLSYDIVKAHGGELKVESTEGEGATFIIELPA